jgi:hypothetical protein
MKPRIEYVIVAALTLISAVPFAQGNAPRKLGAPTAMLEQEFTGIDGIFELKDGRVILLDPRESAIHLIDFKAKASRKIGRDGDGPGEYRRAVEIWPSSGDSALIRDFARFGRLMVVTPNGELGGFVSTTDSALSKRAFQVMFVDRAGRFYGPEYTAQGTFDSARVVRWDRGRGTRDTVARFRASLEPAGPPNEADVVRDRDGRIIGYRPATRARVFRPQNSFAVAGDGRVAIVRAAPYQVSIIELDGRKSTGPAIRYAPVPIADAEKEQWIEEGKRPGLSLTIRNGVTTTEYRKGEPRVATNVDWPDAYPPFVSQSARFASDGTLWVLRHVRAGAPPLYDVFDRAAKLTYTAELPPKTKLVGFGAGTVYLARVDDDDLHYLERYALPASRPVRP